MQAEISDKLLDYFQGNFEMPFTGSVPEWLNKHLVYPEGTPHPGKFDIGICPWLKEVYEAIQDPNIEIVIMKGASQTFKTGVSENIIAYWLVNDPGKVLKYHHTKEAGLNFSKTRLMPLLRNCNPVKALLGQQKIKPSTDLFVLPNMDITIAGPSTNFQHGYAAQRVLIDEAHLLNEPGIFEMLFRRTDQYKPHRKLIISTTPGESIFRHDGTLIGDQLALLCEAGITKRRAWKCPHCFKYNLWKWSRKREDGTYSGINWGDPVIKSEGETDIDRTSDNAKLECHYCRGKIEDKEKNRILLERDAKYEVIKDGGNKKIVIFEWPAWVAPKNTFKEACIQFLKAKKQADAHLYEPWKEFTQQVAGEDWSNKMQKVKSLLQYMKYDSNSKWAEEKYRFMAVDLQGDGRRYYMIIAFDAMGNGRLINYGVVHSWLEIEQLAVKYNVQMPTGENAHFVGIDCGYDWKSVAAETVRHGVSKTFEDNGQQWKEHFGWLCLRGSGKEFWQWADGIKRAVSEQEWYDAGPDNPPARLYYWSNKAVKNLVASIRDGHNKLTLSINTQDETLQRQLYSEYPDAKGDWKEKSSENHLWDVLCQNYALGILAGIPFFGEDTAVKS